VGSALPSLEPGELTAAGELAAELSPPSEAVHAVMSTAGSRIGRKSRDRISGGGACNASVSP
jgi:hypothetical protein